MNLALILSTGAAILWIVALMLWLWGGAGRSIILVPRQPRADDYGAPKGVHSFWVGSHGDR